MPSPYSQDLAFIHDVGFCRSAEAAAEALVARLGEEAILDGTVVELGCGSGASSRILEAVGFDVVGYDLSEAMIELARRRAPRAEFRVGSFLTAQIPPCVAVTAFNEVCNYAFDEANGAVALAELFARVRGALAPGGLLIFDVAGPRRAPGAGVRRTFAEGDGWAVLTRTETDPSAPALTRYITAFRREGELYRRSEEAHRQLLFEPEEVFSQLEEAGFSVETSDRYGDYILPLGLTVFLARPAGALS